MRDCALTDDDDHFGFNLGQIGSWVAALKLLALRHAGADRTIGLFTWMVFLANFYDLFSSAVHGGTIAVYPHISHRLAEMFMCAGEQNITRGLFPRKR